jgi:hypothetical protein
MLAFTLLLHSAVSALTVLTGSPLNSKVNLPHIHAPLAILTLVTLYAGYVGYVGHVRVLSEMKSVSDRTCIVRAGARTALSSK